MTGPDDARRQEIMDMVARATARAFENPVVCFDAARLRAAGWDTADATAQVVVLSALTFAVELFDQFQLAQVETAATSVKDYPPDPDDPVRDMFMRMSRAQLAAWCHALRIGEATP